jgi:hypothetical protein
VNRTFSGTALVFLASATAILADDIRVYTVPKERPPAHVSADAAGPSAQSDTPIKWTVPAGWQERTPGNMVLGSLSVPGKNGKAADVSVTMFGGSVGGELANINRWRNQLGLEPVSEPGKSETVSVGGESGKLYEIANNTSTILVATVPHNGNSWFFKLKGDKETVENAKPAFNEFLKSVQFTDAAEAANAADPHAGLNIAPARGEAETAAPSPEADSASPKMDVPDSWKPKAPGPMVLKSYLVTGSKGGNATVTITTFPGDVGGKLQNVNRWRRQLGQSEVDESELATAATAVDDGYSVDIEGTDAKSGKPARLVAVAIPHNGNTWFYKLLGDKNTVEESKDTFLKFVKSVRY